MDPDTLISMHPHRNEEIISWVPSGVMRHDDGEGNKLVTDSDHLMVMGAGSEFWHEERTLAEDPPLRMLQIFVRPHSLDLDPQIQHEPIPEPVAGEWRHLFGPVGTGAPLSVRNEVDFYDAHLDEGDSLRAPPRWRGGTRTSTCSRARSRPPTRASTRPRAACSSTTTD